MTRKYSLVMESGSTGFSGYVTELPSILVTGSSADELTTRATEAIRIYWEVLRAAFPHVGASRDRSRTAGLTIRAFRYLRSQFLMGLSVRSITNTGNEPLFDSSSRPTRSFSAAMIASSLVAPGDHSR